MVRAILFDVDGVLVHPWRFRSTLARDYGITEAMTATFFRTFPGVRRGSGRLG